MLDRLETMRLFVSLVELGSFTRAAHVSSVSPSTVSKQLARLEARLGATLLRRSTRGQSLTEAGQAYFDAARRIVADFDAAEQIALDRHRSPHGTLRIASTAAFIRLCLFPSLPRFIEEFPGLKIEFEVSESLPNLVTGRIDLAIYTGFLPDSDLIATKVGAVRQVTVATRDLLLKHGTPISPHDLASLPAVACHTDGSPPPWSYRIDDKDITSRPEVVLTSSDAEHVRCAALASLGIAQGPAWLYKRDLAAGRLVEILASYAPATLPVQLISATGRHLPLKAKAYTRHVADGFASWAAA